MAMSREKLAQSMEFPPAIEQPNVYPLSWHHHTKKLEEIWDASQREVWDPKKLPWDTFNAAKYTWEQRECIAYWWTLLSVFDARRRRCSPPAFIKTYEAMKRMRCRCFFSVTRDEQNHEQMCGLAITKFLEHPDPLTYEPKTEIGKRCRRTPSGCTSMAGATGTATRPRCQVQPGGAVQLVPDGRDRGGDHLPPDGRGLHRAGVQGRPSATSARTKAATWASACR